MSKYVAFDLATTIIYGEAGYPKIALRKANEKIARYGYDVTKLEVCEKRFFHEHVEEQVKRVNMMSGKEYLEPVNTPAYLSPSRESYWTM